MIGMNQPASASAFGFTPAKIGLVILLSVVLAGTLAFQFLGDGSQQVVVTNRNSQPGGEAVAPRASSPGSAEARGRTPMAHGKWAPMSLADATAFDPFAFPIALSKGKTAASNSEPLLQPLQLESAAQTATAHPPESSASKSNPSEGDGRADSRTPEAKRRLEEQRAIAAELQRRGVGVILRTSTGSIARIGDLELRVGDVVNGLRVAEIGPQGVRFVADADEARQPPQEP